MLIQSRVVEFQKQDIDFRELWNRQLTQHFVALRAKQVKHDLPAHSQWHGMSTVIKLALQASLKHIIDRPQRPKLVLMLVLTELKESQEEHVQPWRILDFKLVAETLSLLNLLPLMRHGHREHFNCF